MKTTKKVFLALLCFMSTAVGITASEIKPGSAEEKAAYSARVKDAFRKGWKSYWDYARGLDAVNPIAQKGHNWYSEPLLMTPVDAYSTMCIMGLEKEKKQAKDLIFSQLDFDKDMEIQQFEIAIRIMGGLLSAYQLDGDPRFLALAEDLGKRMMPVFESPTGIPYRLVNLRTGAVKGEITNPCEVGSMLLEYGMLSKLTGKPEYYEKCKRGVKAVFDRRAPKTDLVGSNINVINGEWTNTDSHIGGGIDAYYEYLLKGWLLFDDKELLDMWNVCKKGVATYLADDGPTGFWYGMADMNTGKRTGTVWSALSCFYGACLCLDNDIESASKLQASINRVWDMHGLEPETIDYSEMKVVAPFYMARPEAIEAAYYLWHYTKDPQYYETGKRMFDDIEKHCQLPNGYSQIKDVRTMERWDTLESFFFAEVMKYCYLFFAPEDAFSLDRCVLNTEAHPFFRTWDKQS